MLRECILQNIRDFNLIQKGDRVLLSLSGGPDSTALFHIFAELRNRLKFQLTACYLNHNLRPEYIDAEIAFCAELCSEKRVELIVVTNDVRKTARLDKLSLEEAGRNFRRESLEYLAGQHQIDKIATGHHQDDIIETIIFRLFRGTGPGGLNPIRPVSGKYIRPMFNIPKDEILEYLNEKKLKYMFDHTNQESDFSRNFIRNELIPVIEREFGNKYRRSLLVFAEIMHEQDRFLNEAARKVLKKTYSVTPGGKIVVDLDRFLSYDLPLRRIMSRMLLERSAEIEGIGNFDTIARIGEVAEGVLKASDLGYGIRAHRANREMVLSRGAMEIRERTLSIPGKVVIPELHSTLDIKMKNKTLRIILERHKAPGLLVSADTLIPPVVLRGIQKGDRFRPYGMKGQKKVGDFLTDRKIPGYLRDEIPVIADSKGIVCLAGIEIDNRFKVTEKTRKVLEIAYAAKARRR